MLLLRLAIRNILRHPRKSILIASLIAAGMALLFTANAIFESTSRGLETSYIGSLTGNLVVGALAEETYGVFGSEVPIVSEYEGIPPLADFGSVSSGLADDIDIAAYAPIVSAAAQIRIGRFVEPLAVFGVDPVTYFKVCSDIEILKGKTAILASGGVFLNERLAQRIEKVIKRRVKIGERITFSTYSGGSFRIRRGTFAGVYRYPAPNEALDRVVLADPVIVRGLSDYTLGFAARAEGGAQETVTDQGEAGPTELDDLFSDANDMTGENEVSLSLSDVERTLRDVKQRDTLVRTDAAAWSFVLVRTDPDAVPDRVGARLKREFAASGTEARILNWRTAAGSSATMLFAVRAAFSVGVAFLIFGAALVVMNALVISVLERTEEIGSMRALGATKSFVRTLFILESMILVAISSVLGLAIGSLLCSFLNHRGITLSNPLLISLFGGDVVRPSQNILSAATHLGGALVIGALAWIYPVFLALKIEPVSAMRESTL